jgi:tagatose-6-phosphate ketose/aldose isomerase
MQTLLQRTPDEQLRDGYFHTLREIFQQPSTWLATCAQMLRAGREVEALLDDAQTLILTGSGSSEYAGDCVRLVLQNEVGITTQVIGGGTLLTQGSRALPPGRPGVIVSIARSGDSPESAGAVSLMLETEPQIRHLILTCNENGGLAVRYQNHPKVRVIALDDRTNDRSLVMTSSFTNLALAARFCGLRHAPEEYLRICESLSRIGDRLLKTDLASRLEDVARSGFRRAVFLGSDLQLGAVRESALKMLEMTAGRVTTLCETYLGFRHGPMSYVHSDTLMVCFLSSEPLLRAYEFDLLQELNRKELGLLKVIVGENVPAGVASGDDAVIECPGLADAGDENAPIIHVVVGQLLAFFRCLEEGLRPDSPSEDGVIRRVVESFTLHRPEGQLLP